MSGRAIRGLSRRVTLATSTPSASDSASHSAPRTWARYAAVVAALCALLGLAGCGGGGTSSGAPAYEVQARVVAGLGKIITDGKGFTLYVYTPTTGARPGARASARSSGHRWFSRPESAGP
jgi:hypothetical protein